MQIPIVKAHAYGNDFLLVSEDAIAGRDAPALARALCDRHCGIGADGLIAYAATARGAAMRLFNADGSFAEVSGNGVRCLAAWLLRDRQNGAVTIETDGGVQQLRLLEARPPRYRFRAAMGTPEAIAQLTLDIGGEKLDVTTLRVGNPQCVVLEPRLDEGRLRTLGPAIATHAQFPAGTNVEFAHVVSESRVDILIWERGVGPTRASGTGACAAAIAAALQGRAGRSVDVVAPGGVQHVDWVPDGLLLTGWAQLVMAGECWLP